MINKGNLSGYKNNDDADVYIPDPNNGWSNGMQIPTNKPPEEPQKLILGEGRINFKHVSIPAGFVYHKISIPTDNNSSKIKHTSVKINDNDSFIYANTPTVYDEDNIEYIGRNISKFGITYVMYPHVVLRIEFLNTYYIYDRSGSGTTIPNGGINFDVSNYTNNIKAVLVEIFIELDIRNLLNASNNFLNHQWPNDTNIYDIYDWLRECIIINGDKKSPIKLFNESLNDILNRDYVNFICANITKYNCYKENDTIMYSKQENGENYFTSKNSFLEELNKTGTPGDGNVFYDENGNTVNIYNNFHNDLNTGYNIRGIFNYRDIENIINDETIENDIYYLSNEEKDNIIFLESVALSLMRYYELNNMNNYVNYYVNDLSNSNESLITILKNLTTAEDDILWGNGIPQLQNSMVSAYTFKKNKILLKVRK